MVDELNLHPLKNPCPYDGHTKRQEAKELLRSLQGFNAEAYDHLAAAMRFANAELWPAKCGKTELADKFHAFWQQKRKSKSAKTGRNNAARSEYNFLYDILTGGFL